MSTFCKRCGAIKPPFEKCLWCFLNPVWLTSWLLARGSVR